MDTPHPNIIIVIMTKDNTTYPNKDSLAYKLYC